MLGFFIGDMNEQSKIEFGGYDKNAIMGDITWIDLVGTSWWQVPIKKSFYGAKDLLATRILDKQTIAIIDSGTSLLVIPPEDY